MPEEVERANPSTQDRSRHTEEPSETTIAADPADIGRASADFDPDRLPPTGYGRHRPSDCLPPTISGRHCLPPTVFGRHCLQSTSAATTFHIRDNGRGIAAEDMDKVFAPFRRAGRQDVPGEGMGLAYVQALVRRHGGRIWCESEPGVGSTFSFTIPNHRAEDWQKDMKERADRTPVHPEA